MVSQLADRDDFNDDDVYVAMIKALVAHPNTNLMAKNGYGRTVLEEAMRYADQQCKHVNKIIALIATPGNIKDKETECTISSSSSSFFSKPDQQVETSAQAARDFKP